MINKTRLEYLRDEETVKMAYINEQFTAGKSVELYWEAINELKEIQAKIEIELCKPSTERTQNMSRMEHLIERCNEIYEAHKDELDYIKVCVSTDESYWNTCGNGTIMRAMKASKIPTGVYWTKYASKHKYKPKNVFPVMVWDEVYEAYNILFAQ